MFSFLQFCLNLIKIAIVIELVKYSGPIIAAIVAYISTIRAFIWVAGLVEHKLSRTLKKSLITRLDNWWRLIRDTPFPTLARAECENLLEKYNEIFKSNTFLNPLKIGISLFLTMLAFFTGNSIQLFALVFDIKIPNITPFTYPVDEDQFMTDQNIRIMRLLYSIIIFPQVVFLVALFKAIKEKLYIRSKVIEHTFRYIIYYTISVQLASLLMNYVLDFGNNIPTMLFDAVILIVLHQRGLKMIKSGHFKRFVLEVLLSILVMLTVRYLFEGRYGLYTPLFTPSFYFVVNWIFDSLTIMVTVTLIGVIVRQGSIINFFLILADILLALVFSIIVYFNVHTYDFFINILLYDLGLSMSEFLARVKISFVSSITNLDFGLFLFSMTTLIPTIIYFFIIILSYFSKITIWITGRSSRMLFYNGRPEEKKTPVYLSLVLFAVIIAFIPAFIGWLSTSSAVSTLQ